MIAARMRFLVALGLFLSWLGWLGLAVAKKDQATVVSRAQLTTATHLIVADLTLDAAGLPDSTARVVQVLRGPELPATNTIEVLNLLSALPPGRGTLEAGPYLLPVVFDGRTYRIAGLPRSPGYEPATPARPVVYAWTEATRLQLQQLGFSEIEPH